MRMMELQKPGSRTENNRNATSDEENGEDVTMEEDEVEMSYKELQMWIRDQVEKSCLASFGGREYYYSQLQSLLKRKITQTEKLVSLCKSVSAFEQSVKELYSMLGLEYIGYDFNSGCSDAPISKDALPDWFSSKATSDHDAKGSIIVTMKEVKVVLTKLSAAEIKADLHPEPPQIDGNECESLSSAESEMCWEPEPDSSGSDISDFTKSAKRRKMDLSRTLVKSRQTSRGTRRQAVISETETSSSDGTSRGAENETMETALEATAATNAKCNVSEASKSKTPQANKTKTAEFNKVNTTIQADKKLGDESRKSETSQADKTRDESRKLKVQQANKTKIESTKSKKSQADKTTDESRKPETSQADKTKIESTKSKTSQADKTKIESTKSKTSQADKTTDESRKSKTQQANKITSQDKANSESHAVKPSTSSANINGGDSVSQKSSTTTSNPPNVPLEKITVNMKVVARRKALSWHAGKVTEIITKEDGRVKYKVAFEEKGRALVSGHHIALAHQPKVSYLSTGARVVIETEDGEFMPGIVAEVPGRKNHMRFMVFTDDHTPVYIALPKIRLVCQPLADPLDDIPDNNHREFMRDYLRQWPFPAQTHYRVGQKMRALYNGTQEKVEVLQVDCSLIEVIFEVDQHKEWLYRGSIRLEQMLEMYEEMGAKKSDEKKNNGTVKK
ncbi:histone-lysine N-methyltransferase SETDB1-A [Nothobranchius furzeri]|uniref:Histone-lysine N-methyltransferase SETDB1-A-like n=3 Tax=Nothobranchius furzeri TaxID=105023 RepID=A0A8C6PAQ4_NOTFU|nr:histone-lysine N-methyltransferase SETDB1-A-like [Nothobranchius furzeri]